MMNGPLDSSEITIAGEFVLERDLGTCIHGTLYDVRQVASGVAAGAVAFGQNRSSRQEQTDDERVTLLISNERDAANSTLVETWQRWGELTLPSQVSCQRRGIISDGAFAGCAYAVLEHVQSVLSEVTDEDLNALCDSNAFELFTALARTLLRWNSHAGPHGAVLPSNILQTADGWKLGLPAASTSTTAATSKDIRGLGVCLQTVDQINAANLSDGDGQDESILSGSSPSAGNSCDLTGSFRFLLSQCLEDDPARQPSLALLAEPLSPLPPPVAEVEVTEDEGQRRLTWKASEAATVCAVGADTISGNEGDLILQTDVFSDSQQSTGAGASNRSTDSLLLPSPDTSPTHWKLLSVSGQLCRVGPAFTLSRLPEMEIDRVMVEADELLVDLRWPQNIHNAVITVNTMHSPRNPMDGNVVECCRSAVSEPVRIPYNRSSPPTVRLVAYSRENQNGQWEYSAGNSAAAQRELNLSRHCRIDCRVTDSGLTVVTSRRVHLPEIVLTGRCGTRIPVSHTDGQQLARIPAHTSCGPRKPVTVPAQELARPYAVRLFCIRVKNVFDIDIRMQTPNVFR